MSTDPVFSEVQKINPSAIIELFTLQLDNSLHGATTIYRFHSGSNLNANGEIVWAGNSYQRFPIEATGFAYQRGDAVNFPGNSNPLGTPDPTAEFKRQIFTVDRKSAENRDVVEFELAGAIDMAGVRAPKRQCTRALFPSIGTFTQ
jgi:phage-related protein